MKKAIKTCTSHDMISSVGENKEELGMTANGIRRKCDPGYSDITQIATDEQQVNHEVIYNDNIFSIQCVFVNISYISQLSMMY